MPPTPFDSTKLRFTGRPVLRKEDDRLLRGRGRFTDDFALPRQAFAAFVRSPYPHAVIGEIDTTAASRLPGVLGIFTPDQASAAQLNPIGHKPVPSTRFDLPLRAPGGGSIFIGPHLPLPADRVRHVGEAVVMVVANSHNEALDAAEIIEVQWEEIGHVSNAKAALDISASAVWDETHNNLTVDGWHGDKARADAALAASPHVVSTAIHVGRVTGVPLEPRSALAQYDAELDTYTLFAGSGGAVRQRGELAGVLGIEPQQLRVVSLDVGGNFGTRNRVYVEFALVLWASRVVERPVKYTASRSESFLSDYQGRDLHTCVTLGIGPDGTFQALRADNLSNLGARAVSLSPLSKGAALVTGSYTIPAAAVRTRAAFTNTVPTQAYRSSGRPEVNFALERAIDTAARTLHLDPIAIRRRNLVTRGSMPFTNPIGATYDSGAYEQALDKAVDAADLPGFAARKAITEALGKCRGLGIAHYVESSIGAPHERAEIRIGVDGRTRLVIGTQPTGQGQETSFAQVTADCLGIDFSDIDVVTGDTAIVSSGGGSHSGRSMRHAGTVISMAAEDLIGTAKRIIAQGTDVDTDHIDFEGGVFRVAQSNLSMQWTDVAKRLEELDLGEAFPNGLEVMRDNEMHTPVFPNGCAVCEVVVDPQTGEVEVAHYVSVDDVGRAINPLILHGQAHGSIVQGLGQALLEQVCIDKESGQTLTGSLMDYALPRADMVPPMTTIIEEVLSPTNPLGIKSGGEGATTPSLAATVNAVVDALWPLGVRDLTMPMTPFHVWRAIRQAGHSPDRPFARQA